VIGRAGRPVLGPLRADLEVEWRRNQSTRVTKAYDVTTVGVVFTATR
jgi:hypothetical protein